jgi:hypothetical protein
MSDMQSAFWPILNFARFQCFLPIKSIRACGKCTRSSLAYTVFAAILFTSASFMAYLIFCDLVISDLPFIRDALFTCVYFSNVQIALTICCTSHNFIRTGCKWFSQILGTFAECKLQTTSQSSFLKKHTLVQYIKICYGTCVTISLMNMHVGKGNKLSWQFQVLKCIYQLQIYTVEQIITTLNDYFHQRFIELRHVYKHILETKYFYAILQLVVLVRRF